MEKSPESKKHLEEDAEFRFFDKFGNAIDALDTFVSIYQRKLKQEILEDIQRLKDEFYRDLENFEKSGYTSKGKINPDSLKKFYEFKDLDWTVEDSIEKIKKYIESLKPEKQFFGRDYTF